MENINSDFLSKSIFLSKATWIMSILLLVLLVYYLINIGNKFIPKKKKIKVENKNILKGLALAIGLYILIRVFQENRFLYDIVTTLIISAILAYAFNPIINFLEKKNIKRKHGVLILYLSIVGIFFIFSFIVIPRFGIEIRRMVNNLPRYLDQGSKILDNISKNYYSAVGELPPIFEGIEDAVKENIIRIQNIVINGLQGFIGSIVGVALKLVNIVLTPIITYYFLADKNYFKKKIINIIPEKHKEEVFMVSRRVDKSLSLFIRGKLLMAIYIGITTTVMLFIMRIDFAILIGFITGFANIIPYIGPFIGFIPAVFFAAISNPIKIIWVSILFVFIQWVENNVLAPKIIGETMDIHPLVILLSIIIGGGVFGVFGMILSVPVVAIVKILIEYTIDKIKSNKLNSD